ncbi:MAG: pepV [Bacillales bacterium]|jgi:succinyl-diaminopimelate desuccinylase|nr:pepV [Bacillales bacterium]
MSVNLNIKKESRKGHGIDSHCLRIGESKVMTTINWLDEVENRRESLISDLQSFLQIKSTLDETTACDGAPFGQNIRQALEFILEKAEKDGFSVKNTEGYAGHIEYGQGKELLGVLGHVDVVPEGSGWNSDPFGAEIRDNRIYARGAIDDKGPIMAAYYGLKIIKELGLELNKRIRIILGCDEENLWRCVEHYFAKEEMPSIGFSPDADFPIINAEKGLRDFSLNYEGKNTQDQDFKILSFHSGERFNMVPEYAKAVVEINPNLVEQTKIVFEAFCVSAMYDFDVKVEGNTITFEVYGVSAHGSLPHLGKNAGLKLAVFLANYTRHPYFRFIKEYIAANEDGNRFGIAYSDEITKELTINYGIFQFEDEGKCSIALNLRYPVTFDMVDGWQRIHDYAKAFKFKVFEKNHMTPHHVSADSDLVRTLQKVYSEQTGMEATLHSMGGATYARSLKQGVAFGPLFPGQEDVVHQKNEYIGIDELIKMTAIYAQSIYELTK